MVDMYVHMEKDSVDILLTEAGWVGLDLIQVSHDRMHC